MGRATAERLAELGCRVAVLDLASSQGKSVAEAVGGEFFETDILDYTGTQAALAAAAEWLGGLHIAVTTAGGGVTPDGLHARRTLGRDGPHDLDAFRWV